MSKPTISQVLKQPREWFEPQTKLPDVDERVIVRLLNVADKEGEDENYIYAMEDIAIGQRDEEGNWMISPPYPKYDYSRLSKRGILKDNVIVTHWAVPMKNNEHDELNGWETRFDQIRTYEHLVLEVDEKNEEDVYRALLWAANFMAKNAGPDFYNDENSEMRKFYEILCDLQQRIDASQYNKEQKLPIEAYTCDLCKSTTGYTESNHAVDGDRFSYDWSCTDCGKSGTCNGIISRGREE